MKLRLALRILAFVFEGPEFAVKTTETSFPSAFHFESLHNQGFCSAHVGIDISADNK